MAKILSQSFADRQQPLLSYHDQPSQPVYQPYLFESENAQQQLPAFRPNRIHDFYNQQQLTPPPVSEDVWWMDRIMSHLERSLELILSTEEDVPTKQQHLITFLMDVLQQQPDPSLIELMIDALARRGIAASQYSTQNGTPIARPLYRCHNYPKNERCLVRLGPLVLELRDDGGYSDVLRCARDLCQLKHTQVTDASANQR